jgi:hypothetical protein
MANTKDKIVGAVNGAFGNLLAEHQNPLAQQMTLYFQCAPIAQTPALVEHLRESSNQTIAIFIHGLGNTEHIWDFPMRQQDQDLPLDNYGIRLFKEFDICPLFLRYNTGLTIEENGRQFDALISALCEEHGNYIKQIILVGFSMGGLISRVAQGVAKMEGINNTNTTSSSSPWLHKLKHAIYIGTPHEGAPLEKFTNYASALLTNIPKTYFSVWGEQLNLRSTGVKNLGTEHSQHEQFKFPEHARHYFIAGSIWKSDQKIANWLFGDSLVRQESAIPKDRPSSSKTALFNTTNHIRLAHSNHVWCQIREWLADHYPKADPKRSLAPLTDDSSNQLEQLKGAALALGSASTHIIDLAETIHISIANEPFKLLNQVPLVHEISKPIELVYNKHSTWVYSALKDLSKTVRPKKDSEKETPSKP